MILALGKSALQGVLNTAGQLTNKIFRRQMTVFPSFPYPFRQSLPVMQVEEIAPAQLIGTDAMVDYRARHPARATAG